MLFTEIRLPTLHPVPNRSADLDMHDQIQACGTTTRLVYRLPAGCLTSRDGRSSEDLMFWKLSEMQES